MRTFIFLLFCVSTSFAVAQYSPKAIEKNNQAVKIVMLHISNPDSLSKAIRLLDEAIAIDPSYKLAYENKSKYLMAQGHKEDALKTLLQIEELASQDPYYVLGKGLMLEENAKKERAMEAYKQAVTLFEKRLKEKPNEADLMNYVFALFLRDNKYYPFEEIEKKYPNLIKSSERDFTKEIIDSLSKMKREDMIHKMISGR